MTAAAQNTEVVTTNALKSDTAKTAFQHEQEVRAACIEGRRLICGKILDVLPDGLVVENGYTNLLREPLTKSWLVPGTVEASRPANLIEGKSPGAVCVGLALLTNPPGGKKLKPAKYDYVIIEGYPAGQYTYTSAGVVRRTVRRFSASLAGAVSENLGGGRKARTSQFAC